MSSKITYKEADVVESYAREKELQAPEKTIFNLLKDSLSEMKMLDLGVGGGRTTRHFAKSVKTYIGIDYSEEMIAACKQRYSEYSRNSTFQVCDVRNMEMLDDNTFDFILFSFNGIDSISHDDRLTALSEIQRVGKSGGYFCFSTHNRLIGLKHCISLNPIWTVKKLIWWFRLRYNWNRYNKHISIKQLQESKYAIINDGWHNYSLQTYYIRPMEQIKQLKDRFRDIRVYSNKGRRINDEVELNSNDDIWLYYLCVIR